jgi:hypothetical protein
MEIAVYIVFFVVVIVYTTYQWVVPYYVMRLLMEAEFELYNNLSLEPVLREEVSERLQKGETPHIRRLFNSRIVRVYMSAYIQQKTSFPFNLRLEMLLLESMIRSRLISMSVEAFTREEMERRSHLYEFLDEVNKERFTFFVAGGEGGTWTSWKLSKMIRDAEEELRLDETNEVKKTTVMSLISIKNILCGADLSYDTIEAVLVRKLPLRGGRRRRVKLPSFFEPNLAPAY